MKHQLTALVAAVAVLSSCSGGGDPADPPTSQDSLTTTSDATTSDVATTTAPPDDTEETSAPADDVTATTEAGGAPEMPEEAKEDSESGAEAFALHYVDLINYTSKHPEVGLLGPLGADDCGSCQNRESSVAYSLEHGERMMKDLFTVGDSVSLHDPAGSSALVRVNVTQVGQDVIADGGEVVDTIEDRQATLVFDLTWSDGWNIQEIQVDSGKQ